MFLSPDEAQDLANRWGFAFHGKICLILYECRQNEAPPQKKKNYRTPPPQKNEATKLFIT